MDDKLSDIFAFILSSDKVSVEDAEIIREFKANTDAGKTSVYRAKMGELRIKYDDLLDPLKTRQPQHHFSAKPSRAHLICFVLLAHP